MQFPDSPQGPGATLGTVRGKALMHKGWGGACCVYIHTPATFVIALGTSVHYRVHPVPHHPDLCPTTHTKGNCSSRWDPAHGSPILQALPQQEVNACYHNGVIWHKRKGRHFGLLSRTKKNKVCTRSIQINVDKLQDGMRWRGDTIIHSIILSDLQPFVLTLELRRHSHPLSLRQ